METSLLPFGPGALVVVGIYLVSLLAIGYFGYRSRRENTLQDFYLGGRSIRLGVLVLTLYATQYSGNTLFGFSGKAYRDGFSWLVSVHFMTSIVVFYLMLAPRLHALARRHGFVTPTDFLEYRFHSRSLNVIAALLMVIAIANFLLAQLMAMGRAMEGLTSAPPEQAYFWGVIMLAMVIVVYETLGGFRAVAWTDVVQGSVLMIGFFVLLWLAFGQFGTLEEATRRLAERGETAKLAPPSAAGARRWLSYILIVGLGAALYPQALQRIYAARSATALRRSLAVMAVLPLGTAMITVMVGILGAAYLPGLADGGTDQSDAVLTIICREIQQQSALGYWLVVVLFAGILAGIMSTADSVLLSISSMLTKDIYARLWRPQASQAELTRLGKGISWGLIAPAAALAILLREQATLVQLLDIKFDLLVQLAPAFFLGLHWRGMRSGPTVAGLVVGIAMAVGLNVMGLSKPAGIHAGLCALAVNGAIAVVGSCLARGAAPDELPARA